MNSKARRKKGRTIGKIIAIILLEFIFLPYLIPLSVPAFDHQTPFENSHFVTIDGVTFHYRIDRPEDKTITGKVLLVHGLAGSTFSFQALAPRLAEKGFFVLSLDLPGFGYSDRPLDYDHSQQNRARDIWRVLRSIDEELSGKIASDGWHLAGHSMGGGSVVAMSMKDSERTKSLVLIDPALTDRSQKSFIATLPPMSQWFQVAIEHWLLTESNITRFLGSAYGREPTPEEVEGYLAPLRLPGTARSLSSMFKTSKSEDLGNIRDMPAPILAIWGEKDTWVPLSEFDPLLAVREDVKVEIIEGAGHCPMETHTDATLEVLTAWFLDFP